MLVRFRFYKLIFKIVEQIRNGFILLLNEEMEGYVWQYRNELIEERKSKLEVEFRATNKAIELIWARLLIKISGDEPLFYDDSDYSYRNSYSYKEAINSIPDTRNPPATLIVNQRTLETERGGNRGSHKARRKIINFSIISALIVLIIVSVKIVSGVFNPPPHPDIALKIDQTGSIHSTSSKMPIKQDNIPPLKPNTKIPADQIGGSIHFTASSNSSTSTDSHRQQGNTQANSNPNTKIADQLSDYSLETISIRELEMKQMPLERKQKVAESRQKSTEREQKLAEKTQKLADKQQDAKKAQQYLEKAEHLRQEANTWCRAGEKFSGQSMPSKCI